MFFPIIVNLIKSDIGPFPENHLVLASDHCNTVVRDVAEVHRAIKREYP